nr:VWA domain-containing protein [Evansella tamaricis]
MLDRSDSITSADGDMTAFVRDAVASKNPEDSYAIVSIGRDATVERMLTTQSSFSSDWNRIPGDYTNIEAGLQLSSSLLSDVGTGRIVVLSDGNENVGDAVQQAGFLREQGITVDVVPFYRDRLKDVSLQDFGVPSHIFKGELAPLSLTVSSTEETETTIRILLNNETIIQETLLVKEGINSFHYSFPLNDSGMHRFRAEVLTDGDSILENNQLSALTVVGGDANVLFVEGAREEQGKNGLYDALVSSELNVTRISSTYLPTELNGYLQYDSIIFSNVSSTGIQPSQMELIEKAVRDFGVGFVMTGGQSSFALGGYRDTPIEKLLPVEMEINSEEELPSLGMMYVIDRSGSMQGMRLELAKEAAARSVNLLREGDTVGVIAFDDQNWQIVETSEMTDRDEVMENILGITVGGGTDIYPALEEAYHQIQPFELQRRHIILLTDGISPETGNYQMLIGGGLEENITMSAVAIGDGADHFLLEQLAEYGAGRFYSVYDETTIPSILAQETMLATRTYIEDEPFYPTVVSSMEWTSHLSEGVPEMNAYIVTTPKGRSTSVLRSEKDDPILSRWQYGLGKTVAWTSDVEGVWSGDWAAWDKWSPLWNEVVTWTFSVATQEPFEVSQKREGMTSILTFISEDSYSIPLDAIVVNERGEGIDTNVRMTAPGEYEVSFDGNEGMHYVQLVERDEDQTPVFQTGITVSYPDEYKLKPTNEAFLEYLAASGEGIVLERGTGQEKEVFRPLREPPISKQSIAPYLILIAFLLFFMEVAMRRFGIPHLSIRRRVPEDSGIGKGDNRSKGNSYFSDLTKKTRNEGRTGGTIKSAELSITRNEHKHSEKNDDSDGKLFSNSSVEFPSKPSTSGPSDSQDRMKRLLKAKNRNRK